MKGLQLFGKKSCSGLDLGHDWTKVVRLQPKRKTITLERIGRRPWSALDRQKPEALSAHLKTMFKDLDLQDKGVVTSLAGHSVIIKHIEVPHTGKSKRKQLDITSLASQHIPFETKDVFLDYHRVGLDSAGESQNIMLVASKKSMVLDLQKTIDQAGMGTIIVDVDGFALNNCFEYNYPEHQAEAVYLLDIGAIQSIFSVHNKQSPAFIRDASFGGQHISKRLSSILNLKLSEIEQLKIQGFDPLDAQSTRLIKQELQEIFSSWAEEIQRLIHFYRNTKGSKSNIATLYLSGGGSLIQGLPESLAASLDLEVKYHNPWRAISSSEHAFDPKYLQSCGPQFCVATGLALRSVL